jgi:hypothetical protein
MSDHQIPSRARDSHCGAGIRVFIALAHLHFSSAHWVALGGWLVIDSGGQVRETPDENIHGHCFLVRSHRNRVIPASFSNALVAPDAEAGNDVPLASAPRRKSSPCNCAPDPAPPSQNSRRASLGSPLGLKYPDSGLLNRISNSISSLSNIFTYFASKQSISRTFFPIWEHNLSR